MKVEFLEDWKHQGVDYEKGDRKSFDETIGEYFCKAGIGKDLSGAVKTDKIDFNKTVTVDIQNGNNNDEVVFNG